MPSGGTTGRWLDGAVPGAAAVGEERFAGARHTLANAKNFLASCLLIKGIEFVGGMKESCGEIPVDCT
jgi:hypothetical protein